MTVGFLKKMKIDSYFLERQCPYTKRRPFKLKTLYWIGGVSLAGFVLGVLFFGGDPDHTGQRPAIPDYTARGSVVNSLPEGSALPVTPDNGAFEGSTGRQGQSGI